MAKSLFIAEKPSVAAEFAAALGEKMSRHDGFCESDNYVVTWCVGHLVTMSYPERYDSSLKSWKMETLPFLPKKFLYETIPASKKQFGIVSGLLNRQDVGTIYVCTDSGREGEYIYRLVRQEAGVRNKTEKRVWIDSQTEEEIKRGIREAKPLSEYDRLADSAYLRAKEDYLMGINFSRALSIKYAEKCRQYLRRKKYEPISVGRVMTCVLGMVVKRDREIRNFVRQPFFKPAAKLNINGITVDGEWKVSGGSRYEGHKNLYKDCGFFDKKTAEELIDSLKNIDKQPFVEKTEKKKETKNPPMLYNLADLQNDCSRLFRISPDETLKTVQELYEKKLVTYPRTDARVLSSAVAKEIGKNISGLTHYAPFAEKASEVLSGGRYRTIGKTRYTNDKLITDHYAIIPTGTGFSALGKLSALSASVYRLIVRRFLSVFYPPAIYEKVTLNVRVGSEVFVSSARVLKEKGYLVLFDREDGVPEEKTGEVLSEALKTLRKNMSVQIDEYFIKEGETSPPKKYTSGSIIIAMENAGQLIEDEELRAQIKSSGIGTSATRAEILKKLVNIKYLSLYKKNQVISATQLGEMVYEVVNLSVSPLLNPELTASWEKGLGYVADGTVSTDEYMEKLEGFVSRNIGRIRQNSDGQNLIKAFESFAGFYKKGRESATEENEKTL